MRRTGPIRIMTRTTIRATWTPAGIRTTRARTTISPMLIPGIRNRPTWGHLRCARGAITAITPMDAHLTATMAQTGSLTESLLASGRGAVAGVMAGAVTMGVTVIVVITEAEAMPDAATTDTGKVFPEAGASAVGTVAAIPAEAVISMAGAATVADTHLMVADTAMEAETHIVAADAALAEVDAPIAEADAA